MRLLHCTALRLHKSSVMFTAALMEAIALAEPSLATREIQSPEDCEPQCSRFMGTFSDNAGNSYYSVLHALPGVDVVFCDAFALHGVGSPF